MSTVCNDLCCFIRFTLHLVGLFVFHSLFSQNSQSRPGVRIKQDDCLNYHHSKKGMYVMDAFKISIAWEAVAPPKTVSVFIRPLVRFRDISESGKNFFFNLLVQPVHLLPVRSFIQQNPMPHVFHVISNLVAQRRQFFRWVACSSNILHMFCYCQMCLKT